MRVIGMISGTSAVAIEEEAMAMAVLAYETWHGRPGTLPEFTGVQHPVLMGVISPGRRMPHA